DSLIARGPGRSGNGNFVMTKIRLAVIPAGGKEKVVKLQSASADFSQQDFSVASALEGKPGWAIYPEVGKPHHAVFQLDRSLMLHPNPQVVITHEFSSQFGQHQPGRFLLAATDAVNPHGKTSLPDAILAILKVPAAKRSDKQKDELRTYYRTQISSELRDL